MCVCKFVGLVKKQVNVSLLDMGYTKAEQSSNKVMEEDSEQQNLEDQETEKWQKGKIHSYYDGNAMKKEFEEMDGMEISVQHIWLL